MPSATHALGCKKYSHVNLTSLNLIHLTYPRKQFKTYNMQTCQSKITQVITLWTFLKHLQQNRKHGYLVQQLTMKYIDPRKAMHPFCSMFPTYVIEYN
jgi:hypothetical protein